MIKSKQTYCFLSVLYDKLKNDLPTDIKGKKLYLFTYIFFEIYISDLLL